ncbi:hypothetical protein A2757_01905 [Candidatus Giovannonibacteria bacterium RIFCSPHIGHO2_01_FULL_48_47]|nr:MAG: hypothetical protein A2757_01905 [Candidatus Giovannonibacteria bacterium RIFCSPHIGHO2_01_FULL_48_47]OGF67949.1 MAG: hypothetical protein A3D61_02550 [Candidatus Giovannonibacteria bacterium RIFCSPHIGHO2_02_FULL_48_15]OGF88867.1 MAG: hypothetical protein A3B26_01115 [Candidatus Giovannonibacteria bacterium RIFCSPLOWO2_01_FULL_48_47]OGF96076.1 MAG: hypothetical protein A2613_00700 [Candidatus Giovannonibacteria bacterium RIFOXYD1_FULL_48_21]HBT81207.1 hypothetical protein [Candidatus Gio
MKLKLENFRKNTLAFMRDCGYAPIERSAQGEWNFAKSLMGRDYPRFHCYVKEEGINLLVNLHLDQKKPSYAGSSAHSGEYEGEVVETEAERIRRLFQKSFQ